MTASAPEIEVDVTPSHEPTGPTGMAPATGGVGGHRLAYRLATGGMATIFLAFPEGAQDAEQAVALKQIHPHLASQRAFVEMFLDEARIAARIDHANVARVLDYGAADGTYFLTMELLYGRPLSAVAKQLRGASVQRRASFAAYVVAAAAEGLHAAHELRDDDGRPLEVVHRDVSPHNLFVTYDGRVKVVDFGIARARGQLHHTETGTVKGKFAYMAPEQMLGAPVDRRADVWSLGVVLFELVTGRRLFRRSNETETVLAVSTHERVPLEQLPDDLPLPVVAVIDRALSPQPSDRYPSARALGEALRAAVAEVPEPFGADELTAWMDALFPGAHAEERERATEAFFGDLPSFGDDGPVERSAVMVKRPSARRRPRALVLVLGALVLAAGLAAAAVVSLLSRPPPRPAPIADVAPEPAAVTPTTAPDPTPDPDPDPDPDPTPDPDPDPDPAPSPDPTPAPTGRGTLAIATVGGWADVYLRGRRLGTTPGRFVVPSGRHTLIVRPHGGTETRRVRVSVPVGGTRRVRVDLR